MRITLKSFATTALLACAIAQAQAITLILEPGKTTTSRVGEFSEFRGSLGWVFDPAVLTAHPESGWSTHVSIVEPATPLFYAMVPDEPDPLFVPPPLAVEMPLTSLVANLQGQSASVARVQSAGGLLFSQSRPDIATLMPFTHLTNMRVDWSTQGIYADLFHNTGTRRDVRLMSFASVEGQPGLQLRGNYAYQSEQFLDLRLTREGHGALSQQGLDLPAFEAMGGMGYMHVTAMAQLTAVPEPSRTMLTMLGLGLVGLVASRRKQW